MLGDFWKVVARLFRGFLSPLACPDLIRRESTALRNVPGEGGRLFPRRGPWVLEGTREVRRGDVRSGGGRDPPPWAAAATTTGPARLHRPGCQARGAGGRKGWRCEGRRRAGTGAPRCRCNKNASHGTAHGEGRDRASATTGGGKSGGGQPGGGSGREVKGLAKFSVGCGRRAPGEWRTRPQGRSAGSGQAGYDPGAPAAAELPGPRQAGARRSPRRLARPRSATLHPRCPLSEPGALGGGRTTEPRVLPRTAAASSHRLPQLPGHGELRTAAAALGLLRGGRRWVVTRPGPHPSSLAPAPSTQARGVGGYRGSRTGSPELGY